MRNYLFNLELQDDETVKVVINKNSVINWRIRTQTKKLTKNCQLVNEFIFLSLI